MRDLAPVIDDRHWRARATTSFLDIGAGNGKVLRAVAKIERIGDLHAIEKSGALLQTLPENVFILGVDFWNTSLFDKEIGFVFSNPPYSRFEEWSAKIIREAPGGSTIYLVIPDRWQRSEVIGRGLKARKLDAIVLGSFDFESAEDRAARAKVHLLKIRTKDAERWVKDDPTDPFVRFFEETFTFPDPEETKSFAERIEETQVVHRVNFIEALCLLYDARMAELQRNYQAVVELTPDILKEFDISRPGLIESLRQKLATAKKEYWQRLFDGMSEINRRLTASSRTRIVELMQSRTGIEFNRDNAYAIVLWVIRHANAYFDRQLIETFESMVEAANVENYVSNQRVFRWNRFRYDEARDERSTHFRLKVGHRIVLQHCGGLENGYSEYSRGLTRNAGNFLCDLIVVARNLGFDVIDEGPREHEWKDSDPRVIRFRTGDKVESLYRVRAFFNRNLHMQFHPDFIHALNVQHGKLRGWLRDDSEAAEELEIPRELAAKHFVPAFRLMGLSALPALTNSGEGRTV
ncbi:MAG: DUF4942 domain-containing protein [Burkholderiales bacterium]|nr:MAG: DUF4942 domain-containing protein [Burkholderiales bacterium]